VAEGKCDVVAGADAGAEVGKDVLLKERLAVESFKIEAGAVLVTSC
jgi:hypothetical protein